MQAQVNIAFEQLVQLAKQLPAKQWALLKQEVEKSGQPEDKEREAFRQLLLNGPVFSQKQIDAIAKNRKAIDQWREK